MARENDFYLDFGSNAEAFAADLQNKLSPVSTLVQKLQGELNALGQTGAAVSSFADRANARRQAPPAPGKPPAPPAGDTKKAPPASDPGKGVQAVDTKTFKDDMARAAGGMDLAVDKMNAAADTLATVIQAMGRAQKIRQTQAGNYDRQVDDGAVSRTSNGRFGPRGGADATGKSYGRGTLLEARIDDASVARITSLSPSAATTPQSIVSEAAFDRVVKAIDKSTKKIVSAIEKGGTGGGSSGKKGKGSATGSDDSTAGASEESVTRAEVRANKAREKVARKKEAKAARDEARTTREEGFSQQARVERLAQLEAPLSPDFGTKTRARTGSRYDQADLRRMAQTYQEEGYGAQIGRINSRTSKKELTGRLQAAAEEYRAQGGTTRNDLSLTRAGAKRKATEIDKDVAIFLKTIVDEVTNTKVAIPQGKARTYAQNIADEERRTREAAKDAALGGTRSVPPRGSGVVSTLPAATLSPKDALDILRQNSESGGKNRGTRGDSRQSSIDGRNTEYGSKFGTTEGRRLVDDARRVVIEWAASVKGAASAKADLALQANPKFNPYSPALDAAVKVKGSGEEAKATREALGALRKAITEIDKVLAATRNLSPGQQEGLDIRRKSRDAFDARVAQRNEEFGARDDLRYAGREAEVGRRNASRAGSGASPQELISLFPALRQTKAGRYVPRDETGLDPDQFNPVNKAKAKKEAAQESKAILEQARTAARAKSEDTKEFDAKIKEADRAIELHFSQMIEAYNRIAKRTKRFGALAVEEKLNDDGSVTKTVGIGQQQKVNEASAAEARNARSQAAARQKKAQDVGADLRPLPDLASLQRQVAKKQPSDLPAGSELAKLEKSAKAALAKPGKSADEIKALEDEVTKLKRNLAGLNRELEKSPGSDRADGSPSQPDRDGARATQLDRITNAERALKQREAELKAATRTAPSVNTVASLVGKDPRTVVKSDLAVVKQQSADSQIEAAREVLAQSGVRWSKTLNASLNDAKTVEQLFAAIKAALKKGTLEITSLTGKSLGAASADGAIPASSPRKRSKRAAESESQFSAEDDAAFKRVNQLKSQIAKRERLNQLNRLQKQAAEGQVDQGLLRTVQGSGSNRYTKAQDKSPERLAEVIANAIKSTRAQLTKDEVPNLRSLRSQLKDAIAASPTSDGVRPPSGGKGSGSGGDGASAAKGGGFDKSGVDRIVSAINAVHSTLKSGIKVTGRASASSGSVGSDVEGDANARGKRKREYSTAQGRADFRATLPEDLRKGLEGENKLGAAIEIVTQKIASQAKMVAYLREELKVLPAAVPALENAVRSGVGDKQLVGGASAKAASLSRSKAEEGRALGRTQVELAQTMGQVSTAAQKEVETLRKMVKAGEDSAAIGAQQIKVYRALNAELERGGISKQNERTGRIKTVLSDAQGTKVSRSEVLDIGRSVTATSAPAIKAATDVGNQVGGAMANAAQSRFAGVFGASGFWSRVLNSTGTFIVRNFTAGAVFGVTNALQDALQQGIETESTFVRVSEALTDTGRSTSNVRASLAGLSQEYGVALKDVYKTAAGLTGLFDESDVGNKNLLQLTRVATQLQLISGGALNATEAMRSLASVTSAYGAEASNVSGVSFEGVADILTTIQNQLGVNIEESIEGVARLSGQAKELGIEFANVATYVAAISKYTGQSGSASGEQFQRILAALQTSRTQAVVGDAFGEQVAGQLRSRDFDSGLKSILLGYKDLDAAEKNRVATAIGGQKQAAAVNALFIEGERVVDIATKATNSNGAANKRAGQISEQLAAKIERAKQAFVNFISALVAGGALNAVGVVLQTLLFALNGINAALNGLNEITKSLKILGFMQNLLAALAGFLVITKVATLAWKEFSKALIAARVAAGVVGIPLGGGKAAGGLSPNAAYVERRSQIVGPGGGLSTRQAAPLPAYYGSIGGETGRLSAFYANKAVAAERASGALGRGATNMAERAAVAKAPGALGWVALSAAANRASQGSAALSRILGTMALSAGMATLALGVIAALFVGFAIGASNIKKAREEWTDFRNTLRPEGAEELKPDTTAGIGGWVDAASKAGRWFMQESEETLNTYVSYYDQLIRTKNPFSAVKSAILGKADLAPGVNTNFGENKVQGASDAVDKITDELTTGAKSVDEVKQGLADARAILDQAATDFQNDKTISAVQLKEVVLPALQKERDALDATGLQLTLAISGTQELVNLSAENIAAIGEITGIYRSLGRSTQDAIRKQLQDDLEYLNLDPQATAQAARLKTILAPDTAPGELSGAERAKRPGGLGSQGRNATPEDGTPRVFTSTKLEKFDAQVKEIDAEITVAQAAYDLVKGDTEKAPGAQAALRGLYTARNEAINAELGRRQREADAMLSLAISAGDPTATAAAIKAKYDLITKNEAGNDPAVVKAEQQSLTDQQLQITNQDDTRALRVEKAGQKDAVKIADLELQIAKRSFENAKKKSKETGLKPGDEAYTALEIAFLQAQLGLESAKTAAAETAKSEAESAAAKARAAQVARLNLGVTRIDPSRAVAVAAARARIAANEQAYAARTFGRNSAEYYDATSALIEAQRAVNDAMNDVVDANFNLAIAYADASGRTVEAARLRAAQAAEALNRARKAGGTGTADYKNAKAAQVAADASLRDAQLNYAIGTINFNKDMERITTRQAISQLQELLKLKNLTEDQRRGLLLQIKGLEDELNNQFSGQWNIGDNIKMPTPYEVRRAIGVDDYVDDLRKGARAARDALQTSVADVSSAGAGVYSSAAAPTTSGSNSDVVRALEQVSSAIAAKGDYITNEESTITINGADIGMVTRLINDALGPVATQRSGTYTRKGV